MTNGIQGNVWNGPIEAKAPEIGFALQSPGPHPDIPIEQRIFSPMIGSWDLDVIWYEDGARSDARSASGISRGFWRAGRSRTFGLFQLGD